MPRLHRGRAHRPLRQVDQGAGQVERDPVEALDQEVEDAEVDGGDLGLALVRAGGDRLALQAEQRGGHRPAEPEHDPRGHQRAADDPLAERSGQGVDHAQRAARVHEGCHVLDRVLEVERVNDPYERRDVEQDPKRQAQRIHAEHHDRQPGIAEQRELTMLPVGQIEQVQETEHRQ